MQAFKIDIMALLVIAVVLGVGVTMALGHFDTSNQSTSAPEMNTRFQMHTSESPVKAQFIDASQAPGRALKLESRI